MEDNTDSFMPLMSLSTTMYLCLMIHEVGLVWYRVIIGLFLYWKSDENLLKKNIDSPLSNFQEIQYINLCVFCTLPCSEGQVFR